MNDSLAKRFLLYFPYREITPPSLVLRTEKLLERMAKGTSGTGEFDANLTLLSYYVTVSITSNEKITRILLELDIIVMLRRSVERNTYSLRLF